MRMPEKAARNFLFLSTSTLNDQLVPFFPGRLLKKSFYHSLPARKSALADHKKRRNFLGWHRV
jgi:hypothetical protein